MSRVQANAGSQFGYQWTWGLEKYQTMARLMGWVARWPFNGDFPQEAYGKETAEYWAWVWSQAQRGAFNHDGNYAVERLMKGQNPTNWGVGSAGYAHIFAEGLILAIAEGAVIIPADEKEGVVRGYASWVSHKRALANASVSDLLRALELNWSDLSDQTLQTVALVDHWSAKELGSRGVPLGLPELQNPSSWVEGYISSLPVGTVTEDATRFLASTNEVERYSLWHGHVKTRQAEIKEMVIDPADPFGRRVYQFLVLTGADKLEPPTYDQCLAHLQAQNKN